MATSRFTRTCCFARAREPAERLTETIAGNSSGVSPTAIARENRSASSSGRPRTTLMRKTKIDTTRAIVASSFENFRRPTWNPVSGGRSASPDAILPKLVEAPVPTTTPRPEPCWTIVPMNTHDDRSASARSATGATSLLTGKDSPVSTLSSLSSWSASSSRMSAGTMSPIRSATTSPGTSCVTSTFRWCPSRQTTAWRRIFSCSCCTAIAARYSLTKPSPTLSATMTAMMMASVGSPVRPETPAATSSKRSRGLRSWPQSTARARTRCKPTMFGPYRSSRPAASVADRPESPLPSRFSTSCGVAAAAVARSIPLLGATASARLVTVGSRALRADQATAVPHLSHLAPVAGPRLTLPPQDESAANRPYRRHR